MTEVKPFRISDAAAEWLLSALGTERLFAAVMAAPAVQDAVFRGGFQPAPATLDRPAVRRRLRAALLGRAERVEALLQETGDVPWAAAAEFVRALDEAWLRRHWRGLLRGSADPALAVALALDPRAALRQRGRRLFGRTAPWRPDWMPRPDALPPLLRQWLSRGASATPRAPMPAPEDDPGSAHLRAALSRQRDRVREGQQELRQAHAAWEQREKELRREVREARSHADRVAAAAGEQVAEAIRAFKHQALGITPEVLQLTAAVDEPALDALLQRAEAVLEEQRQQNEKHGTYESVRARVRALSAMAQRLCVCMDESVRVLPDVRRVHATLCRELERLRALLPEESVSSELTAQLLGRIKEAGHAERILSELDRVEQLLRVDVLGDLLGPDGLRHVRAALSRRRQLVQDTVHTPAGATPAVPPAPSPREIWDVRGSLADGTAAQAWVFVDGYNVIRRTPDLAAMERHEGLPRSREAFCQLCRQRSRAFAHLEIVFDGQGALSAREETNGFAVVFSKGLHDSQNADEYLVARTARAHADGKPVWLVTDDGGLRAQAETYCRAFVGSGDWVRFLRLSNG